MANPTPQKSGGPKTSVKAPLMFSTVLALVAGVVTLITSTGGTSHQPRWDLASIAFGIAFVVALVVSAMLSMSHKENAPHLGQGSGVNLTSAERLAQQQEKDRQAKTDGGGPASA
ncbi:hypothetical protein ACQCSX_13475 [Pseudarthrobacter sp. P1]|uniref:hypothetical protein n=1 Tax=Pseudarthrobacter sp. P1 TaxID=3418418 RepID=UPI003CEB9753